MRLERSLILICKTMLLFIEDLIRYFFHDCYHCQPLHCKNEKWRRVDEEGGVGKDHRVDL